MLRSILLICAAALSFNAFAMTDNETVAPEQNVVFKYTAECVAARNATYEALYAYGGAMVAIETRNMEIEEVFELRELEVDSVRRSVYDQFINILETTRSEEEALAAAQLAFAKIKFAEITEIGCINYLDDRGEGVMPMVIRQHESQQTQE